MKQFAFVLTLGVLLAGAPLYAQEAKPKTYTLVVEGVV
jgi:hypothetical protein